MNEQCQVSLCVMETLWAMLIFRNMLTLHIPTKNDCVKINQVIEHCALKCACNSISLHGKPSHHHTVFKPFKLLYKITFNFYSIVIKFNWFALIWTFFFSVSFLCRFVIKMHFIELWQFHNLYAQINYIWYVYIFD